MRYKITCIGRIAWAYGILGIIVAEVTPQTILNPILTTSAMILMGFWIKNIVVYESRMIPRYGYIGYGHGQYAMEYFGHSLHEEWISISGNWAYVLIALLLGIRFLVFMIQIS